CPYDNAVAESFFRSLKAEEVYRWYYKTCDDMKTSIAEYIGFYNKIRPHQTLKYRTPNQFESDYYVK
ncbi:MAG: IS3 family transposase, partial [Eubacteriales bacterium]